MKYVEETQVIILAGGLGTRLRPFTETIPKPMIDICGKPFLEHKLVQLKNSGTKKVLLCVAYLGEKIEGYFKDGKDFGLDIKYSYEKELMGTAGAVKQAESLIETDPFIVMNGDTHTNLDLEELLLFHHTYNLPMTMAVTRATNPTEQELVKIKDGLITNFYKRKTSEHKNYLQTHQNLWINMGAYVLTKKILDLVPHGIKTSFEMEIFPTLSSNMAGFYYEGYMKDLANIEFCRQLEQDIILGEIK